MMHSSNMPIATLRLNFFRFTLKDDAKKWIYSIPVNFITKWDGFVRVFLRKYIPNSKIFKLRMKSINLYKQIRVIFEIP